MEVEWVEGMMWEGGCEPQSGTLHKVAGSKAVQALRKDYEKYRSSDVCDNLAVGACQRQGLQLIKEVRDWRGAPKKNFSPNGCLMHLR